MSNWAGISTSVINDISPLLVVIHATCANDHFDRVIEYLYSKAYVIFVGVFRYYGRSTFYVDSIQVFFQVTCADLVFMYDLS